MPVAEIRNVSLPPRPLSTVLVTTTSLIRAGGPPLRVTATRPGAGTVIMNESSPAVPSIVNVVRSRRHSSRSQTEAATRLTDRRRNLLEERRRMVSPSGVLKEWPGLQVGTNLAAQSSAAACKILLL